MDKNFIGERISELRLKKNVSEYQMSYDLGHSQVIFIIFLPASTTSNDGISSNM